MRFPSVTIGEHSFDPARGILRAGEGRAVTLRPKTAQVLMHLAERGGEVVTRQALIEAVWPGVYVTENGLTQCVAELRRALGADEARLQTLPRRGYLLAIAPPVAQRLPAPSPVLPRRSGSVPVLAMMPLRLPPGADPDLAACADILLDGVVGTLAALREPIVISASSARMLAGAVGDVPAIARQLGADYLASGSLTRLQGELRLSIELAEAAQGTVVWQRSFALEAAGVLDTLHDLAATIAHAVVPRLRDAELRLARRRRHDLGAYHLLLEAQRAMARLERASFEEAGAMLRRAAALDPGFAEPHAVLANWHSLRIGQQWSEDRAAEARALEAEVHLALELDGTHARALALLGHTCTILHHDFDRAQALLDRARDIAPNDAETSLWMSPTLAYAGRGSDAVASAERAMRLSPEDPLLFRHQHFLSIAHYAAGAWEEASEWGLRALRNNANYTSNITFTAAALAAAGRTEEARRLAKQRMRLAPIRCVRDILLRVPFRDRRTVAAYGDHLIAAGLPG